MSCICNPQGTCVCRTPLTITTIPDVLCVDPTHSKLEEELDAAWMAVDLVKKENARYQNALEKITGFTESDFMGKWASEYDLIEIARNALKGKI